MLNSNNTPFTDILTLCSCAETKDADGYTGTQSATERNVFGSFSVGVNRADYYESMKAGVRLSATAEVWEIDFKNETHLRHNGNFYKIGRTWPTGEGTLYLYLEEVIR